MCRLKKLLKWMKSVGVVYDESLLLFAEDNSEQSLTPMQIKIVAKRRIRASSKIGRIPKYACLSVPNVPQVHIRLEKFGLANDSDLSLVTAITHEMAIGGKSRWYGYLTSLPAEGEYIPLLWPDHLINCLQPSDLRDEVEQNKARYHYFWQCHALPLLSEALGPTASRRLSFDIFLRAVSFAGSRAFYVDRYHGEALVPLADMFNHKVAFLPADAEVEGASNSDSSTDSQVGSEAEDDDLEEDGEADASSADRAMRRPTMDMALGSFEGKDWLPVMALRPIPSGAEVYNTYGEYGNRKLLCCYAFAAPRNPFDAVPMPPLRQAATATLGPRLVRRLHRAMLSLLLPAGPDGLPAAARRAVRRALAASCRGWRVQGRHRGKAPNGALLYSAMCAAGPSPAEWVSSSGGEEALAEWLAAWGGGERAVRECNSARGVLVEALRRREADYSGTHCPCFSFGHAPVHASPVPAGAQGLAVKHAAPTPACVRALPAAGCARPAGKAAKRKSGRRRHGAWRRCWCMASDIF